MVIGPNTATVPPTVALIPVPKARRCKKDLRGSVPLAANLTLESYVGVLRDRHVHSLMETVTGTYGIPYPSFSSRDSPSVNTLEREELEVILLIEPATLEKLQGQVSSSGQCEGIDRELDVRVRFLSCFRLVVEDVDVTVADLEEINMPRDDVALEI